MQFVENGVQHTLSNIVVYHSKEYGLFKMINGNRALNENKIKRIIKDIESGIDMLAYYPIQVVENDGRLEIIDGQHRFYISKKLKRPVHYIVLKKAIELPDIAKVNSNTEKWKTVDFINCYIQQGNDHYKKLQEFMDLYGFAATTSMKLLSSGNPGTESGYGGTHDFQRGGFQVTHWEDAVHIAEKCRCFEDFDYWTDRGFVIAIYRIIKAEKIEFDALLSQYKKHSEMLVKQSGFKEYLFNLESIVNKGKQIRITIY